MATKLLMILGLENTKHYKNPDHSFSKYKHSCFQSVRFKGADLVTICLVEAAQYGIVVAGLHEIWQTALRIFNLDGDVIAIECKMG